MRIRGIAIYAVRSKGADMYKRFAFEGDTHTSLSCVPLAVRRKLDLAGLKISLQGWQTLSREERLALCHLPVDTNDELDVYREVMRGFAAGRSVELKPLSNVDPSRWRSQRAPSAVSEAAESVGRRLDDATWSKLDEEERYCLLKYSDPRREPTKLTPLFEELRIASK